MVHKAKENLNGEIQSVFCYFSNYNIISRFLMFSARENMKQIGSFNNDLFMRALLPPESHDRVPRKMRGED